MNVLSFKDVIEICMLVSFFSTMITLLTMQLMELITYFLDKKSFIKRFKYKELIDFTKKNKVNLDDFVSYSIDEAMKNYKKNNEM